MKIVVAPDSFKGSLSSLEVAEAIARGLKAAIQDVEVIDVPMADGGEGTMEAMVLATGGRMVEREVTGPLGERVRARFGILGDGSTGVVEMAQASGLPLVPVEKRNPMVTTTFGTGELIAACIKAGCTNIILAIGGSATNDGGAGMAQALGAHLLDQGRKEIGFGGGELRRLDRIIVDDMPPEIRNGSISVTVACDVDNPLTGPRGASAVYGPQKGATPEVVEILDAALAHYAAVIRRDLHKDVEGLPGAGAAGGLGAGLVAFLGARLRPGVEIVIEAVGLENAVKGADLVITGEGRIDFQTAFGKTPLGVARVASKHRVPCIAIAGGIGTGVEVLYKHGIEAIVSITRGPMPLEEAMARAGELLADTAYSVGAIFLAGRKSVESCRDY